MRVNVPTQKVIVSKTHGIYLGRICDEFYWTNGEPEAFGSIHPSEIYVAPAWKKSDEQCDVVLDELRRIYGSSVAIETVGLFENTINKVYNYGLTLFKGGFEDTLIGRYPRNVDIIKCEGNLFLCAQRHAEARNIKSIFDGLQAVKIEKVQIDFDENSNIEEVTCFRGGYPRIWPDHEVRIARACFGVWPNSYEFYDDFVQIEAAMRTYFYDFCLPALSSASRGGNIMIDVETGKKQTFFHEMHISSDQTSFRA